MFTPLIVLDDPDSAVRAILIFRAAEMLFLYVRIIYVGLDHAIGAPFLRHVPVMELAADLYLFPAVRFFGCGRSVGLWRGAFTLHFVPQSWMIRSNLRAESRFALFHPITYPREKSPRHIK